MSVRNAFEFSRKNFTMRFCENKEHLLITTIPYSTGSLKDDDMSIAFSLLPNPEDCLFIEA